MTNLTGWSVTARISSCNACAKRTDALPLITTTPSPVTTKDKLLLWPEFSYVGGAVAPMAENTCGMTSTGFEYSSDCGYWSAMSSLAQRLLATQAERIDKRIIMGGPFYVIRS